MIQYVNEGIKLHDAKKYAEAITSYKEALKIDPENAQANYEIAFTLVSTGARKEAIPYLERVTKTKNNTTASAYDLLGSIYDELGQKEKAIANFKQGIETDPKYTMLYYNLAITYVRMGNTKEAMSYVIQSLKLNPMHASSHRLYAMLSKINPQNKVNAVLAYCNFLILETNTERSVAAFKDLQTLLTSGVTTTGKQNNITVDQGKDADLNASNLAISMSYVSLNSLPEFSDSDKLEHQLKIIFSTTGEISAKKENKDFFWSFYADYFNKIAKSEHLPIAARIIGFISNQEVNRKWIKEHELQFINFSKWNDTVQRN